MELLSYGEELMSQDSPVKSSDAMVARLSAFLEADLKSRSDGFSIQNEPLQPDEIASHDGLLSLFLFKAAESCNEAMKKRLPLAFQSDTSALIDVVPVTELGEFNLFSLWTHFLHYSVEEEVRRIKREKKLLNGLIPLDDLYQQWHQAVTLQKYIIKPSVRPTPSSSIQNVQA
jgi:hypothetical protein